MLAIDKEELEKEILILKRAEKYYKKYSPFRALDYLYAWKNKEAMLREFDYITSGKRY